MSVPKDVIEQSLDTRSYFKRRNVWDWSWALLVMAATTTAYVLYGQYMGIYDVMILFGTGLGLVALGWYWKATRVLILASAVASLAAIGFYGDSLANAQQNFFLKYLLSNQAAVMWMSALFVMATGSYLLGLVARSDFALRVGSAMTWTAAGFGLIALLVRWRETYLAGPDMGYIPVSNLYEVFIQFAVVTALLYLHYERRFNNRTLGVFVLASISSMVAFILWYTFDRQAHEIEPLVPALRSWWMTIHVPANFIGYGTFTIAAMVGVAYLLKARAERVNPSGYLANRLPSREVMDDVMYKAIALGFAFFTIATVLGAMWAAEAWGGYWSWDPKETWALIVWLNYAAWLHLRLTKGWRGVPLAWWAIVGLFITLFAFIGVNMFLAGLHSYGEL
ncbi:c-type cytochrome biogenesis protein CcsB [Ectothiorhodospiraceae bacterium 2226]|nr:c-type cytochrome biogenesis protein CcsB [Ectothiorhodospiraceae bacterium 2226]